MRLRHLPAAGRPWTGSSGVAGVAGLSDRDAAEALRCVLRWTVACGLALDHDGQRVTGRFSRVDPTTSRYVHSGAAPPVATSGRVIDNHLAAGRARPSPPRRRRRSPHGRLPRLGASSIPNSAVATARGAHKRREQVMGVSAIPWVEVGQLFQRVHTAVANRDLVARELIDRLGEQVDEATLAVRAYSTGPERASSVDLPNTPWSRAPIGRGDGRAPWRVCAGRLGRPAIPRSGWIRVARRRRG
jgi:hypothetical protein